MFRLAILCSRATGNWADHTNIIIHILNKHRRIHRNVIESNIINMNKQCRNANAIKYYFINYPAAIYSTYNAYFTLGNYQY